ncbi:arrestin domain-containing protein 3-like protein [Aphelenchoides avenae]|nr:arrestin domain-containing protein 3-like protein [Aphelenchus avenae]
MVKLAIRLGNPDAVYRSGDMLQGYVSVSVKRPFKTEAIELSIIGIAKTWILEGDKHHERNPQGRTKYHEKANCYAGYVYYLRKTPVNLQVLRCAKGEVNLRENPTLLAGTYECSFSYALLEWGPLAPSYKGSNGSIKYYCEAMVRRPWFMPNTRARVKFTVLPVVDLRHVRGVKEPSVKALDGTVGLRLFTKDREISATAA